MKRLLLSLALLSLGGCINEDFLNQESVRYEIPPGALSSCPAPGAPPVGRITPVPATSSSGPAIVPTGGVVPPPPAGPTQTREPDLLR